MTNQSTFTFLGTGGSMGVPVIGCSCAVCTSTNDKNKRFRSSAILEMEGKTFLIDAGPDLRMQALRHNMREINGVILTHAHQDHVGGLDDLRPFYMWKKQPIAMICSNDTKEDIFKRYPYVFFGSPEKSMVQPRYELSIFPNERGTIEFNGITINYFTFFQAGMAVNGLRFNNFAYVSDIKEYPETIFEDLKGVEILVISALRHEVSPLHFSVSEAVAFSEKLGAKQTYLTHLSHNLDHEATNQILPPNVQMAYDGLKIFFNS